MISVLRDASDVVIMSSGPYSWKFHSVTNKLFFISFNPKIFSSIVAWGIEDIMGALRHECTNELPNSLAVDLVYPLHFIARITIIKLTVTQWC